MRKRICTTSGPRSDSLISLDRKIHFFAPCIMYYTFIFCIIHNTCRFNNTYFAKMYYTFIFCIIQISKMHYTKYIFGFSVLLHIDFRTSDPTWKHNFRVYSPNCVDSAVKKSKFRMKLYFSEITFLRPTARLICDNAIYTKLPAWK